MADVTPVLGIAMLATLFVTAISLSPGAAAAVEQAEPAPIVQLAQANCSAAAQQVVAQTGGQLLSVSPGPNGTCSVTVLIPGQGNERPRKQTINVPA
jgi:hypothetical protein